MYKYIHFTFLFQSSDCIITTVLSKLHTMSYRLKLGDSRVFGSSSHLSDRMLPKYYDIMKCYLHLRDLSKDACGKDPSVNEIAMKVCDQVKAIWTKASIPYVADERIKKMLVDFHSKYKI
mgnify:CR=1 FL=1